MVCRKFTKVIIIKLILNYFYPSKLDKKIKIMDLIIQFLIMYVWIEGRL